MTEPTETGAATRARPLPVDDRRSMIVDAVIPLLIEHGPTITTRQIADACGIAEGTIFRAFGDKDSLIAAAVEKFLDPEPLRAQLRAIDPALSLHDKLSQILFFARNRLTGIIGIFSAMRHADHPPHRDLRGDIGKVIAEILEAHRNELRMPPDRAAHMLELMAFATSIPRLNQDIEFSTEELAAFIHSGIAGHPAEGGAH